jgi:DNA (cytosine-5)-methyltransferase 1
VTAYYNEIDPKAAAWLRELIKQGHIAEGDVDETDIRDVDPDRLGRYTQCHFFAGIGGWSLALRLAGWPDDRPVWTGSCPCQPFSAAGRRSGTADERHLWPHWHHLISQCQPAVVFGEQVASKDGLGWLDLVQADMEATGYAFAAEDICAAGVGAPHIRQRLWFVGLADASGERHDGQQVCLQSGQPRQESVEAARGGRSGRLADATDEGLSVGRRGQGEQPGSVEQLKRLRADERLADASADGSQGRLRGWQDQGREAVNGSAGCDGADRRPSPTNGHWRDVDWLFCRDGKWRPVEPGTFPLAYGLPARVGRLRGYGNAIVPQVAAAWIEAVMEYNQ